MVIALWILGGLVAFFLILFIISLFLKVEYAELVCNVITAIVEILGAFL